MKKTISFILVFFMLLPLLCACADKGEDISPAEGLGLTVGGVSFTAVTLNGFGKASPALFNRGYKSGEAPSLELSLDDTDGFYGVTVTSTLRDGVYTYKIYGEVTEDISDMQIPVNGFVLLLPEEMLPSENITEKTEITLTGYEKYTPELDDLSYAYFAPEGKRDILARRISVYNPITPIKTDKIYFLDRADIKITPPEGSVAVCLEKDGLTAYKITSVERDGAVTAPALLFTGEYNAQYALQILKNTERITVSMLNKANNISDKPGVNTPAGLFEFEQSHINAPEAESGVYLYTPEFSQTVTPAGESRIDVAVVNGRVVAVYGVGERALIPETGGYVLTFAGEEYTKNLSLQPGDSAESVLIDFSAVEGPYIAIGDSAFGVDATNVPRNKEGMCVLYTSEYGRTTATNEYGSEIAIKDGAVTAVKLRGGSLEIPSGGYVLSMHNSNKGYGDFNKIKVGDTVVLRLNGGAYGVNTLNISAINAPRGENMLVLYRYMPSTGTNEYGYEIAVDENGIAVACGYGGNISVPKNGYVLSGHGTAKDALVKAYAYGKRFVLKDDTVFALQAPQDKISSAKHSLGEISDKIAEARKMLKLLDYEFLDTQYSELEAEYNKAVKAFEEYRFDDAFASCAFIVKSCTELGYRTIESGYPQNRAVWYRATEKTEVEVEDTVRILKELNVNALYLETWYEGYCLGSKVTYKGESLARSKDFDVLQAFIVACHAQGIELHAWVQNFFVGYYYENGNKYYNPVFTAPEFEGKYTVDNGGNDRFYYTANGNYWLFLNPADRFCRDTVLDIYAQLLSKYDIDGLQMDYVRFPEYNHINGGVYDFGYNEDIIEGFKQQTGIAAHPSTFKEGSENHKKWVQYRCDIITSFVGEVKALVDSQSRDIWFSAATYPDLNMAKNEIKQDVAEFVKRDYFDEIFSMSYGVDNAYVASTVEKYAALTKGKVLYSAGIAAFLNTPDENFVLQPQDCMAAGANGVAVFSLNDIFAGGKHLGDIPMALLHQGAWRENAHPVNKGVDTAKAFMMWICGKAKYALPNCEILTEEDLSYIMSRCTAAKITASTPAEAKEQLILAAEDILKQCGDNRETRIFTDILYCAAEIMDLQK